MIQVITALRRGAWPPGGQRLGSGHDHEFACWPGLEVLPGLADVIQPGLLQVQGELPVDRVVHQVRVGGTARLGGRGGLAVTYEREQLVAEGGRVDRGRGSRGAPDLDIPGACETETGRSRWRDRAGSGPPRSGCPPTGPGQAADHRTGRGLAWRRIGELPLLALVPPVAGTGGPEAIGRRGDRRSPDSGDLHSP
jgi:hypothetical protein